MTFLAARLPTGLLGVTTTGGVGASATGLAADLAMGLGVDLVVDLGVGLDIGLATGFFTGAAADLATAFFAGDLAATTGTGFLSGFLGVALVAGLGATLAVFFAGVGAVLTLGRCLAVGAADLAVFLAGDFTSALIFGPDKSRSEVRTPKDGCMDGLVNAGLFIPGLDAPAVLSWAGGGAKLLKKAQNITQPPRIAPNLASRCLWANQCQ